MQCCTVSLGHAPIVHSGTLLYLTTLSMTLRLLIFTLLSLPFPGLHAAAEKPDSSSVRGLVLCGYQGWFRCPGDAADMGWVHWSRDGRRIAPETLSFEMWPDTRDLPSSALHPAPGFTDAAGNTAMLFSADDAALLQRHFEWMRDAGIDGVWLQHFVVDLPGGPAEKRYTSRRRVLDHVRQAAAKTDRVWALAFDISGMRTEKIADALIREWKDFVDKGITADPHYVHEDGQPVVELWGFYQQNAGNFLTVEVANQLLDFFKAPGPYQAYVIGGGDWDWRHRPNEAWQKMLTRLDGYSPWNVGNTSRDKAGVVHAAMGSWAEDKRACEARGQLWLPIVYPGFSWDNLQQKAPGSTNIPRRGGAFLWEQFHELDQLGARSVCVAMFDEVDEGTAIFKVTNEPPREAHFVSYEGVPPDWYLRLTGEATRLLRSHQPVPLQIPLPR